MDNPNPLAAVEQRLARLERSARRWRLATIGLLAAVALAGAMGAAGDDGVVTVRELRVDAGRGDVTVIRPGTMRLDSGGTEVRVAAGVITLTGKDPVHQMALSCDPQIYLQGSPDDVLILSAAKESVNATFSSAKRDTPQSRASELAHLSLHVTPIATSIHYSDSVKPDGVDASFAIAGKTITLGQPAVDGEPAEPWPAFTIK